MLCPQNRTAHCTSHTRAPQNPRRPFRPAVCPCKGLVLRTKGLKTEVCPRRGPVLRTNGRKSEVFPRRGLVLRTKGGKTEGCPCRGLVLRTKSLKTEVCPRRGPILRTNGRRRRFFGNIYFTNRPLVACSAINPLNNLGIYGTKLHLVTFGDVSFTGRDRGRPDKTWEDPGRPGKDLGGIGRYRERSGKTGRGRERLGGQSTTCRAGRWLGWPATNTVYFVSGPPNR